MKHTSELFETGLTGQVNPEQRDGIARDFGGLAIFDGDGIGGGRHETATLGTAALLDHRDVLVFEKLPKFGPVLRRFAEAVSRDAAITTAAIAMR